MTDIKKLLESIDDGDNQDIHKDILTYFTTLGVEYRRLLVMEAEILAVREILWSSHGHTGLYGDDGAMQCAACMPNHDYRKGNILEIVFQVMKVMGDKVADLTAKLEASEQDAIQWAKRAGQQAADGKKKEEVK